MPSDEPQDARGGGVLGGLLAPLRLPERLFEALESLADLAGDVGSIRLELTRVREQTKPLAELLPALERLEQRLGSRLDSVDGVVKALESEESYLNTAVTELRGELEAVHKTLAALQDDVQRATDRLPGPGEKRGPLSTARDVLTGSGD